MSKARIVVCHRSWLFAECLATCLRKVRRKWECLPVSADAEHGTWAQLVPRGLVDLLVLDPTLADEQAVGIIDVVRQHHPRCKVVFLVSDVALDRVSQLTDHRCDGWVIDQMAAIDVAVAIATVLEGQQFCSPQVATAFVDTVRDGSGRGHQQHRASSALTAREREILLLIDNEQLSNKDIGERLHLNVSTVKSHLHRVFEKLGAQNRMQAARIARQQLQSIRGAVNEAPERDVRRKARPRRSTNLALGTAERGPRDGRDASPTRVTRR